MVYETDSDVPATFPVIDISLLSSEDELQKLSSILSSCGCFQAIGHGIPVEFLDKVREVAQQFFALPDEEKQKCLRAPNEAEGYGDDLVVSDDQLKDCCKRLILGVFPEHQRRMNLWPEQPTDFGETLHEYALKIRSVINGLSKAMARSLKLEENSFLNQFGDCPAMGARLNFYPPCPRPEVFGAKAHLDRSGVAVLLQDKEVEGLQVLVDGTWHMVPVIPHALVVNLGGLMQVMTNGMFKSPLHRVLSNATKFRMSVTVFDEPEEEREIGPVDHLVNHTRPRLYRSIRNFAAFNYECFQKGKNSLEELRIPLIPEFAG
ncbi:protein SRG1-like [Rhodamnia argentea]|uniref:Protein SRG1-like n=1 Tax=Rhodamnia argentea TaxID=178133 RepID=A0ABM3HBQ8_9MYRT|nr:protein SRG1-like [Rhodamnia argentea]